MEEPIDHGIYACQKPKKTKSVSKDEFRSDQIHFLSSGVELVRNRFVYKKFDYQNIIDISIKAQQTRY